MDSPSLTNLRPPDFQRVWGSSHLFLPIILFQLSHPVNTVKIMPVQAKLRLDTGQNDLASMKNRYGSTDMAIRDTAIF